MNIFLHDNNLWQFIEQHQHDETAQLLLQRHRYPEIAMSFAVRQIEGRRKAQEKLPSWYEQKKIVYPEKLALEQCSSEKTARYKAQLLSGETIADLTGGFGVDTWAFAQRFSRVFYVERNETLAQIARHNFQQLGLKNIDIITGDSLRWLNRSLDAIYLDPARRNDEKKVVALHDCEPNFLELAPLLFDYTDTVLLKTSPLLDIPHTLSLLPLIAEVHVVSVENECKELLFLLKKQPALPIKFHAVNFPKNNSFQHFVFTTEEEKNARCSFSAPLKYLYEPNASLLKIGAFKSVAGRFNLHKLHASSHLYTSETLCTDFQGRVFLVQDVISFKKRAIKERLANIQKANITVRNFPINVQEIRKLTRLAEGGETYLFATTDLENNKILIKCQKVA